MAKIADSTERFSRGVSCLCGTVENCVVEHYINMETGAVKGLKKITHKCMETFFTGRSESAENAGTRLKNKEDT